MQIRYGPDFPDWNQLARELRPSTLAELMATIDRLGHGELTGIDWMGINGLLPVGTDALLVIRLVDEGIELRELLVL
jgi:hypothetical protein